MDLQKKEMEGRSEVLETFLLVDGWAQRGKEG